MIWRVCSTRSSVVGLRTMVATTTRHFIPHCAIWTRAWQPGRWRNTNALDDIGEGQSNGFARLLCETHGCLLIGHCCIMRRPDDKSRMSGDVHVRICERLGVRLPRATRRVVTCKSAAEAHSAVEAAHRILKQLGVELHPQKTRIVHVRYGFEFLGYKIKRGKRTLYLPESKIRSQARQGALYAYLE